MITHAWLRLFNTLLLFLLPFNSFIVLNPHFNLNLWITPTFSFSLISEYCLPSYQLFFLWYPVLSSSSLPYHLSEYLNASFVSFLSPFYLCLYLSFKNKNMTDKCYLFNNHPQLPRGFRQMSWKNIVSFHISVRRSSTELHFKRMFLILIRIYDGYLVTIGQKGNLRKSFNPEFRDSKYEETGYINIFFMNELILSSRRTTEK